jgi:shikimate dehydrogenase
MSDQAIQTANASGRASGLWGLDGHTRLIVHLGHPTGTFKSPMIYNPYFESCGLNAAVVPLGVTATDFAAALPLIFRMSNVDGALITMPHKMAVLPLLDEISVAARVAGACNAVRRRADGALVGDMFDGEGFARGLIAKGRMIAGSSALVVGSGGVGSAIAASLAGKGLARIGLYDVNAALTEALASRLAAHHPRLAIATGSNDPAGYEVVVNATPLGMEDGDPSPVDMNRVSPGAFVGEVVMKAETTPFLAAAARRGLPIQPGVDMLFEQIPAYLEFFGFPPAGADALRALARISY